MADDKDKSLLDSAGDAARGVLQTVIGDKRQDEGVTPSMSPIDFLAPSMVGAAVEAAPRILANEVGAIGPGVAQLIAKQAAGEALTMAEQIQLAAAKSAVQGPVGGLTNNVAMQQAGTPFQQGALQNAQAWQQAGKAVKGYADGGNVSIPIDNAEALASPPQPSLAPPPQAAAAPSNTVNVFNPSGELVSIPASQLQAATQEGYSQASDDDVHSHIMQEKYGSGGQQVIAGLEGVGQGLAGPLATAAEMAAGVKREDILGREEANPGTNMLGQGAGLIGGSFLSTTEARGLLTLPKLATMAADHLAPTIASKVGSTAVRAAIENMVIQGSNETSKMILQDPKQSVETALVDVGLAGLIGGGIGGAIGAVPPLWKAANESKLAQTLKAIRGDADGELSAEAMRVNPILKKTLATFGGVSEKDIEAYAANRAAVNEVPDSDQIYQHALNHVESVHNQLETAQMGAKDAKASFDELERSMKDGYRQQGFEAKIAEKMAKQSLSQAQEKLAVDIQQKALGTASPIVEAVERLHNHVIEQSKGAYELLSNSGKSVNMADFFAKGNKLIDGLEEQATLEAQGQAEKIKAYLDNVIGQYGADAVPATAAKKMIQGLDAVSKYDYNASAFDKGLSSAYKQLRYELDGTLKTQIPEYAELMRPLAKDVNLLKSLKPFGEEASALRRIKGIKAPDRYISDMQVLRELEERTGSKFTHEIEPYANPEKVKTLSESIPEYKEYQKSAAISEQLKDPSTVKALDEALQKSPEYQKYLKAQEELSAAKAAKEQISGFTPSSLEGKIASATRGKIAPNDVLNNFPELDGHKLPDLLELQKIKQSFEKGAMNGSRNVNLFGGVVGSIMGALGGHGFAGAGIGATLGGAADRYGPTVTKRILDAYLDRFGNVAKLAGAPSPEVAHIAMAKFLQSGQPPSAEGFKAATDYIQSINKGDMAIKRATGAMFKAGREVLPQALIPTQKDRDRLDKHVDTVQSKPEELLKVGGHATQYMDDHAEHMGSTAATAIAYLHSLKPNTAPTTPLGKPLPVNPVQKAAYDRALNIAQQPLVVLDRVKKGTLLPSDVVALKTMYPALYNKFSDQMVRSLTDAMAKGQPIPYNTRIGLSMFMAQPLDGTLTPQAITAAQVSMQTAQMPQQQQGEMKPTQQGMKGMSKLPASYQTPTQQREAARQKPSH